MYKNRFSVFLQDVSGAERPAGEVVVESAEFNGSTEGDALSAAMGELTFNAALNAYTFRGQLIPAARFGGLVARFLSAWTEAE